MAKTHIEVRATAIANEAATDMRHTLAHATPAALGWPYFTAEQLIASEWQCWYDEEMGRETRV